MIYTVTMNPAIDCGMTAKNLVAGRVNRAESQTLRFGGKGINVSYVLKEFGGKSVLTGFTAGFTGDALTAGLTAEGFTCDFVKLADGMTRINVKLTSGNTNGDPDTELNAPGPIPNANELDMLKGKLSRLTAGDAVVLAGSLPAGVAPDYIIALASALPNGVSLICDLSGASLKAALAASPDFVKPNIHELFDLMEIPATKENLENNLLIEDSAARLISMGAKNVLITMGGDGAYYITAEGYCTFIPSPPMPASANEVRSAVGCGDSTVAGWLIGMGYAGEEAQNLALSATGVHPTFGISDAAARLAVMLGSTSYYYGFPASTESARRLRGGA